MKNKKQNHKAKINKGKITIALQSRGKNTKQPNKNLSSKEAKACMLISWLPTELMTEARKPETKWKQDYTKDNEKHS